MAEYANPDALVSADWVAEHGAESNVRLVEVDVDTTAYESGHIAGAVGWNWQSQLSDQVRRDIATQSQWEELLSASGISNDT
ncbi:MAG: sulfurtransferase, partial [Chloroflexi bacterium]|nr:sulfurtransferase [Chloroflexota bacterium]